MTSFTGLFDREIPVFVVAGRLRRRPREQNVPSSIPRLGISVEVTS